MAKYANSEQYPYKTNLLWKQVVKEKRACWCKLQQYREMSDIWANMAAAAKLNSSSTKSL